MCAARPTERKKIGRNKLVKRAITVLEWLRIAGRHTLPKEVICGIGHSVTV
jgi:hypothetical protein